MTSLMAYPHQAAATLELVLPALLDGGISHASDDVRALCTRQLLGLCKNAGVHMKSHVVQLVTTPLMDGLVMPKMIPQ